MKSFADLLTSDGLQVRQKIGEKILKSRLLSIFMVKHSKVLQFVCNFYETLFYTPKVNFTKVMIVEKFNGLLTIAKTS